MRVKKLLYIIFAFTIITCSQNKSEGTVSLAEGNWIFTFHPSIENYIPVDAHIKKINDRYEITFINSTEKITSKSINVIVDGNTIKINDPFFNTWFEGKITSPNKIEGAWFKKDKEYKIPFTAIKKERERFVKPNTIDEANPDITGKWEVDFSKNDSENHYKSIGLFQQNGEQLTGTFITETGDYRYLEGNMYGNNFYLSCYDGSHLFLFKATLKNDTLKGWFWSGKHWEEPWIAYRNETFEFSHPDSLTYLKEGYDKLDFTFPNLQGEPISLNDKKYENKVVIVNIMGPWCPNCKDETAYLTELYNKNNAAGLEIIALSFDRTDDFESCKNNILKLKNYFNSNYDFLIAGKASNTNLIS